MAAPNSPMTEVPWVPRNRESRPAMTSAAIRPCRLAGPGERDQRPLAGHEVLDLDGVPDGEDVRIARAHVLVDADPAALADLQPGRLRQRGVRAHAEGEDHDVGRIGLSGPGLHLDGAVVGLLEPGHPVAQRQADAVPLQVGLDDAGMLPIDRGQDLIEHLHEGHVKAAMDQVLRPSPGR